MDIPVSSAYLPGMFARLLAMLAVLAIAVMTTVTSAHAARLSAEPDHAVHVSETMQATDSSGLSCNGEQPCGSSDAGMCEFACAGLSVLLPVPGGEAHRDFSPSNHDLPSATIHASRAPGLDERPPKLRLL